MEWSELQKPVHVGILSCGICKSELTGFRPSDLTAGTWIFRGTFPTMVYYFSEELISFSYCQPPNKPPLEQKITRDDYTTAKSAGQTFLDESLQIFKILGRWEGFGEECSLFANR